MRKSKPSLDYRSRSIIRPQDNGIISVPIPNEQRPNADKEMKEYIKRNKQKEQSPN